jgi:hypothetical protein
MLPRELNLETNIARTIAALSATNEAILYAKSPEELYRQVCEAAFSSGDFQGTAVFLLEPETTGSLPASATTSNGCAGLKFRSGHIPRAPLRMSRDRK